MKIAILLLCFLSIAYCQLVRTGGSTLEVGAPVFEEIVVESVLTVKSKSASRTGKATADREKTKLDATDGASVSRRSRTPSDEPGAFQGKVRASRSIHPKLLLHRD